MSRFEDTENGAEKMALSRRDFLRGTAAIGAVSVGGAVLGGCAPRTSASEPAATGSTSTAAKEETYPNATPIQPVSPPTKWDREADVVVIGSGGAGLNASVMLRNKGMSVITVERLSETAGGTKQAVVFITYGGSRYQNAANYAEPVFPFNPEKLATRFWEKSEFTADYHWILQLTKKGPECCDWMGDQGVPWVLDPAAGPSCHIWPHSDDGGLIARSMMYVTDYMTKVAKDKGTELLLETTAKALVKDGDRIVGIKAVDKTGKEVYIKGAKGVLLAGGGFTNNTDMLKKYMPNVYKMAACAYGMPCDTGDCVRMGLGAGAAWTGQDSATCFDGGLDWVYDGKGTWHQYLYNGSTQVSRQPWLGIDKRGRRYPYLEAWGGDYSYWQRMDGLAATQGNLLGNRGYIIFDSDYETNIWNFDPVGCRRPITPDMPDLQRVPENIAPHDWRIGFKAAVDAGAFKKANTIEELEKLMEFEPGVMAKAVKDWNALCDTGEDTELHFPKKWLVKVVKAPFYAARVGANIFATQMGLLCDVDCRVLDEKGKVIPGLYGASHTVAGQTGTESPTYGGVLYNVAYTFTTGYIAGTTIAADAGKV